MDHRVRRRPDDGHPTYWPAVATKVQPQVGTVEPGKFADIIAVRGDVLRDIAPLQRVDVVMKHGTRYK